MYWQQYFWDWGATSRWTGRPSPGWLSSRRVRPQGGPWPSPCRGWASWKPASWSRPWWWPLGPDQWPLKSLPVWKEQKKLNIRRLEVGKKRKISWLIWFSKNWLNHIFSFNLLLNIQTKFQTFFNWWRQTFHLHSGGQTFLVLAILNNKKWEVFFSGRQKSTTRPGIDKVQSKAWFKSSL